MTDYIELIDKYIVTRDESGTPSYKWTDNTGVVVRCRDCHFAKITRGNRYKCIIDVDIDEETGDEYGFVDYHDADFFCANGRLWRPDDD